MTRVSEREIKNVIEKLENEIKNQSGIPHLAPRVELARDIVDMLKTTFVKITEEKPKKKKKK